MSGFSNFAISFTIISILAGSLTLYGTGLDYGGPVEEAWGWPIVSVFVIIVGLGDGRDRLELPDRRRPVLLGLEDGGPVWGWFTGWFNLIGQIAITAASTTARPPSPTRCSTCSGRAASARRSTDRRHLRRHPRGARRDEHLQREARRVPQRRLGLVARARRDHHRRLRAAQARPPSVVCYGLRPDGQQQRLLAGSWLWFVLLLGLLHGAVHLHRLRRLRAHERGDPERVSFGGARS